MRNFHIIAAAAVIAAAALTQVASATEPGGSTLHAITMHADTSHEARFAAMTRNVAEEHLVRKGYSPTKLVLVGKTWHGVDAKTGHPLKIDAETGKIGGPETANGTIHTHHRHHPNTP